LSWPARQERVRDPPKAPHRFSAPTRHHEHQCQQVKGEVLSSAIALTDQLYEQSYTLKEERRILWICVGSLLTAQFIF